MILFLIGAESSVNKRLFEFKWDSHAGPVLFLNVGNKKIGFALFCHRKPERCFTLLGHTSPICSRCTGLLLGFTGIIALSFFHIQIPIIAALLMMTPIIVDGFSQLKGFRESNNALRLLTGFLFTFAFVSMLVK